MSSIDALETRLADLKQDMLSEIGRLKTRVGFLERWIDEHIEPPRVAHTSSDDLAAAAALGAAVAEAKMGASEVRRSASEVRKSASSLKRIVAPDEDTGVHNLPKKE